jgi:predicted Zn-dependent peptidase
MMERLIDVVTGELRRAADTAPSETEVARAKTQLKAGLLMGLEGSFSRAEFMAREQLLFNRLIDMETIIERIEAVTPEKVRSLVAGIVSSSKPSVSVVGAGRKSASYADMADKMLTAEGTKSRVA